MELQPGVVVAEGAAWDDLPIAVVTGDLERAAAYLAAPHGPYVVVQLAEHVPAGVRLGGMAVLDTAPLDPGLVDALAAALGSEAL